MARPTPEQEDPAVTSSSKRRHLTITTAGHQPHEDTLLGVNLNEPYEPTFSDSIGEDDSRTSEFDVSYDPTNPNYPAGNPEVRKLLANTDAGRRLIKEEAAASALPLKRKGRAGLKPD